MDACQTASLGVGFSYEEVFEMCQEVAKLEGEKAGHRVDTAGLSRRLAQQGGKTHPAVDAGIDVASLRCIRGPGTATGSRAADRRAQVSPAEYASGWRGCVSFSHTRAASVAKMA